MLDFQEKPKLGACLFEGACRFGNYNFNRELNWKNITLHSTCIHNTRRRVLPIERIYRGLANRRLPWLSQRRCINFDASKLLLLVILGRKPFRKTLTGLFKRKIASYKTWSCNLIIILKWNSPKRGLSSRGSSWLKFWRLSEIRYQINYEKGALLADKPLSYKFEPCLALPCLFVFVVYLFKPCKSMMRRLWFNKSRLKTNFSYLKFVFFEIFRAHVKTKKNRAIWT